MLAASAVAAVTTRADPRHHNLRLLARRFRVGAGVQLTSPAPHRG
jgi:hypothetical protein